MSFILQCTISGQRRSNRVKKFGVGREYVNSKPIDTKDGLDDHITHNLPNWQTARWGRVGVARGFRRGTEATTSVKSPVPIDGMTYQCTEQIFGVKVSGADHLSVFRVRVRDA